MEKTGTDAERVERILEYVKKLDASGGVDTPPLPVDLLAMDVSLWSYVRQYRQLAPENAREPPLVDGYLSPDRLYAPQCRAIAIAVGYIISKGDKRFVEQPALSCADCAATSKKQAVPLGARQLAHPVSAPLAQLMSLPCGMGKTAIILWVSILTSRTILIITKTYDLAVDFVRFILHDTRIARYASVKLLRSQGEQAKKHDIPSHHVLNDADTSVYASHLVDFNVGIAVSDVFLGQSFEKAAHKRLKLQEKTHQQWWDMVALDEFHELMSSQHRQTLLDGLEADAALEDCMLSNESTVSTRRRYKMRYSYLIGMSGTLKRADGAERLVRTFAPITYSVRAIELERLRFLAPSVLRIVVCSVPDTAEFSWVSRAVRRMERPDVCPSKYAMLDMLIGFFCGFLQLKVMVFGENKHVFAPAEAMFPHALNIFGDSHTDAPRAELLRKFKERVNVDTLPLWNTTQVCSVGADVDDCAVVISLHSNSSANTLKQRQGRCTRVGARSLCDALSNCYFFDLLSKNELAFVSGLSPGPVEHNTDADMRARYQRFFDDGMAHKLIVVHDVDLVAKMRAYVRDVGCVYDGTRVDGGGSIPLERIVDSSLLHASAPSNDAVLHHVVVQLMHKALATKFRCFEKAFRKVFFHSRLIKSKRDSSAAERQVKRKQKAEKAHSDWLKARVKALERGHPLPPPPEATTTAASRAADAAEEWTPDCGTPPPYFEPTFNCFLTVPRKAGGKEKAKVQEPPILLMDVLVETFAAAGQPVEATPRAVWDAVEALRQRVEAQRAAWNAERTTWRKHLIAMIDLATDAVDDASHAPVIEAHCRFLVDEQPPIPPDTTA